ncbi:Putative 2/3 transmembrane domain holin [Humidesulfovibrio mexicanus]|uniref:Putative 2/3 transmembrane domain holin n=1 Tax=Humidesulfovibrio mexicanus TaxID=147047 RepID=A0A239BD44_9BACT|nr:putative holin [Humidesulfovibrio mexicanus]SNS05897.1 Putative 2/3 transmembrane domain holin [Humidesulfovibrio mexicanus]
MNTLKSLSAWLRRKSPRMTLPNLLATALLLIVAAMAPHQAPVLMYKLGGVAAGGCLGYLLDVAAFPYAKPSGYLRVDWRNVDNFEDDKPDYGFALGCELPFLIACARRAAIICACMLAVALAL